jgi:thioredoxin 1
MAEVTFTDSNWEDEVIKSSLPVVVDFWASWCIPCRMIAPHITTLADEYKDKVKFGRLNVDENPSTAVRYSIRSIPFVGFFKDGNKVGESIGAVPKDVLEERMKEFFKI